MKDDHKIVEINSELFKDLHHHCSSLFQGSNLRFCQSSCFIASDTSEGRTEQFVAAEGSGWSLEIFFIDFGALSSLKCSIFLVIFSILLMNYYMIYFHYRCSKMLMGMELLLCEE